MSSFFFPFPFFFPPLPLFSGPLLLVLGLPLLEFPDGFEPPFLPFLPAVGLLFPILVSSAGPIGGCAADLLSGGTGDGKGLIILTL